jgi:hypothetical protein
MKLLLWLAPGLLLAQTEWSVPPGFRVGGYTREKRDKGWALTGPGPNGVMTQTIDAAPYRGARIRLRAEVRVSGAGTAQLLLRVDRPGGLGFFDNMGDRPIPPGEWNTYELTGEVAGDARTIEVGVSSSGAAEVGVDAVAFEKLPALPAEAAAAREAILRNYARVDSAYAEGDLDAVASLAMPDAQVAIKGSRTRLSAILTQIMEQVRQGAKFRSRSTITAFRLDGAEATAWVNNESTGSASGVLSANRDLWVKTAAGWRLKESALIAMQPLTPPEVLSEMRKRSGFPDWKEARLILVHGSEGPRIAGFTSVMADIDPRRAAQTAVAYLQAHAPEEAGPADLAFLSNDSAKIAAVTKVFDANRVSTPEWSRARQAAVIVHQSITLRDRPDEAVAAQVIWLASEPYRSERILVAGVPPGAVPFVRARYGKQVYSLGVIERELLGGDYFIDIASVPRDSALGRWLAAQKFPFDAIMGR